MQLGHIWSLLSFFGGKHHSCVSLMPSNFPLLCTSTPSNLLQTFLFFLWTWQWYWHRIRASLVSVSGDRGMTTGSCSRWSVISDNRWRFDQFDPICLSGSCGLVFPILVQFFSNFWTSIRPLEIGYLIADTSWGWKMWHKSKLPETPLELPSQPCVRTVVSSAGVWEIQGAIAARWDHSWRTCSGSKQHALGAPLPRSKLMARWFLGEILAQAAGWLVDWSGESGLKYQQQLKRWVDVVHLQDVMWQFVMGSILRPSFIFVVFFPSTHQLRPVDA